MFSTFERGGSRLMLNSAADAVAADGGAGSSRSHWRQLLFQKHPEILNLMERVLPLNRSTSLARVYRPHADSAADKEADEQTLMVLILDYLRLAGYKSAATFLMRTLGIASDAHQSEPSQASRLVSVVRLAVQDSEKVWDLTIGDKGLTPEQIALELQEHLGTLGLLAEKIDYDDNIWSEPAHGNIVYDDAAPSSSSIATAAVAAAIAASPAYPPSSSPPPLSSPSQTFASTSSSSLAAAAASSSGVMVAAAAEKKARTGIRAASLNKLVLQITSPDEADVTLLKTFLMTYRLFTSPMTLLRKLMQRYNVPEEGVDAAVVDVDEEEQGFSPERRLAIQSRVVNVMKRWISDYFDVDFNMHSMRAELKQFVERLKQEGSPVIRSLENVLIRVTTGRAQETTPPAISAKSGVPDPRVPNNIFSPNLKLSDVDEEEIARQLTLIEFRAFARIGDVELLNQAWGQKQLKHRAPFVTAMIARFNVTSNWVAQSILSCEKLRDRVRMYTRFVKIAEHLRNLNNFQTFQAILAALSSTPIHRLKTTQMSVDPRFMAKLDEFHDLMKSDQSYRKARDALASTKPPAIPYIGIFLKDIVFIADGNTDTTAGGLINFNKYRLLYSVIAQIQQFQQESYNLHVVQQIEHLLLSIKPVDEETLYTMSLKCEGKS